MSEIYLDFAGLEQELNELITSACDAGLPDLSVDSTDSTVVGHRYFLNMYPEFQRLVRVYLEMFNRDVALVADAALSLQNCDCSFSGNNSGVSYNAFPWVQRFINPTEVCFTVDSNIVLSETWEFFKRDFDELISEIISNMRMFMLNIDLLKIKIYSFTLTMNFRGEAATAMMNYFSTVHTFACDALYVCAQTILAQASLFWRPYRSSVDFEEDFEDRCWFGKVEFENLTNPLRATSATLSREYPGLSEANDSLALATGNEYDYSALLPHLYSLPEHLDDVVARCDAVINTVQDNESVFLSTIRVDLESPIDEFVSFISQHAGINSMDAFLNPPEDVYAEYSIDEYAANLSAIQNHNETDLVDVMTEGMNETVEVNTELTLEQLAHERGQMLIDESLIIVGAALSMIATCGADSPYAVAIIIGGVRIICHGSNIAEAYQELEMIEEGDLDPEGFNLSRDTTFFLISDPDNRQAAYQVWVGSIDTMSSITNSAGSAMNRGASETVGLINGTLRWEASHAVRSGLNYLSGDIRTGLGSLGGDEGVVDAGESGIMIFTNTATNEVTDVVTIADANPQYSIDLQNSVCSPSGVYNISTIMLGSVDSSWSMGANTTSTTTHYDDAYSYGIVGGGFNGF